MEPLSPLNSKIDILSIELETAFNSFSRHQSQIINLRNWGLTLFLAYMGFTITVKSDNFLLAALFGIVLLLLMYLEASEKNIMSFDAMEVRRVETIFMETDPVKFTDLVRNYKFRDLRLIDLKKKSPYSIKIRDRLKLMFSRGTVVWYGLEFLLVIATQSAIVYKIIS